MSNIKQIKQEMEMADSLFLVSEALTEISSNKLKKIRQSAEMNRQFFNEISTIYRVIRINATHSKLTLPKNNKTICIVITSNSRLYGSLNDELVNFFLKQTQQLTSEFIIIGSTAHSLLNAIKYPKPYKRVTFARENPTPEELSAIVAAVKGYARILVFYSSMKTVLKQIPTFRDITQNTKTSKEEKIDVGYIFEPEILKMLEFFDKQVTTLLLEEAFLETELAQTAARLSSMNNAQDNAQKYLKSQKRLFSHAKTNLKETQQLERQTMLSYLRKEHY